MDSIKVTAESFGADLPGNWEEIADEINGLYENAGLLGKDDLTQDDKDTAARIWDEYWRDHA